jgi:hypothetical protein
MIGNPRIPIPTPLPFWLKPAACTFGLFRLTTFIKRLHMLTIRPILALSRRCIRERPHLAMLTPVVFHRRYIVSGASQEDVTLLP